MTQIERIKALVPVHTVAEHYGVRTLGPGGSTALCPFHDDHTPSLALYRDHYHCFSCGNGSRSVQVPVR